MSQATWTVREILEWTSGFFEKKGVGSPRLDAELLLARVLGCSRVRLYVDHLRPLQEDEKTAYRALVERRASGEPAAYLLGEKEFYGRPFKVDRRVLVPRPETELLVDRVLEHLDKDASGAVLDLCSGSGCIGVTLAAERPGLKVVAVDVDPDAAAVARENAEALEVAARYDQRVGDLLAPVRGGSGGGSGVGRSGGDGGRSGAGRPGGAGAQGGHGPHEAESFLVVTANPPYVSEAEHRTLMREVRDFEPRHALVSGSDGLETSRRILDEAGDVLVPGGLLALEHGEGQGEALRAYAEQRGWTGVETVRDLAGHDRILLARRG